MPSGVSFTKSDTINFEPEGTFEDCEFNSYDFSGAICPT
jgi:hypothetical protein